VQSASVATMNPASRHLTIDFLVSNSESASCLELVSGESSIPSNLSGGILKCVKSIFFPAPAAPSISPQSLLQSAPKPARFLPFPQVS